MAMPRLRTETTGGRGMTAVLAPTVVAFDATVTRQWLQTLHARSTGFVWVGSTADRFRGRAFDTGRPDWADRATDHVARLDQTGAAGIYLRTTTLAAAPKPVRQPDGTWKTGRGGDDDSLTLPGLAADLDIAGPGHKTSKPLPPDPATAKQIIDESGLLDPSVWVHSGGGLYAWWLLDQPHTITGHTAAQAFTARWQDVIRAASERLGYTYGPVGDLSRILRIPGTVNRKRTMPEPAPCRIIHDSGRRYSLTSLRDCLTDAIAALPAPEPVMRRVAQTRSRDGLAPGDDYEQRTDWSEILIPAGWTFAYEHGGTRYWCRPGKTRRDGISATTGRAADRDRLWVFTDGTDFPQNTPMTKFGAYTLLTQGGTRTHHFAAANQELARQGYGARQEAA
jgi:hypothetical protein